MAYEPRIIPPYVEFEILPDDWYCLDCELHGIPRSTVATHWVLKHGDPGEWPVDGIDVAQGRQLLIMRERRELWILAQTEAFARQMHDGFTADDFSNEVIIRGPAEGEDA